MRLDLKATAEKIQGFFDEKVKEIARQTKFVRRETDLTGRIFLKALVFGCIEKPAATLL